MRLGVHRVGWDVTVVTEVLKSTYVVGEGLDEEDDKDGNVEHGEDLPVNKFVDVLLGNAGYEVMPRWGVSFVRDGDVGGGGEIGRAHV